jgi:O-6-methylguanine DNA methyltransferase
VTHVAYVADGWGEGELWLEGPRLVWHELPRPPSRTPTHSEGGADPPPSPSTIAARSAHVCDGAGPDAERLVHRLQRYFGGEPVDFDDVAVDPAAWTPFGWAIAAALRRVRWGEIVSYRDLARAAGYPNAQRAAGSFCASNRFPLIVPCHRVVAANGPGSYGSLGVEYKRRLLALERG